MIEFSVIERGQPGVIGGGEKKFYAIIKRKGVISLENLSREIAGRSTMSEADVTGVLISMVESMETFLGEGYQIELGQLGSLRISLSSRGEQTTDEVSKFSIKKARILFRPGGKIERLLKALQYTKL